MSKNLFEEAGVPLEHKNSFLTILSSGVGQDSMTILFLLVHDPIFKAKYAPGRLLVLFADTHTEAPETYSYMDKDELFYHAELLLKEYM